MGDEDGDGDGVMMIMMRTVMIIGRFILMVLVIGSVIMYECSL